MGTLLNDPLLSACTEPMTLPVAPAFCLIEKSMKDLGSNKLPSTLTMAPWRTTPGVKRMNGELLPPAGGFVVTGVYGGCVGVTCVTGVLALLPVLSTAVPEELVNDLRKTLENKAKSSTMMIPHMITLRRFIKISPFPVSRQCIYWDTSYFCT